MGSPAYMSPEQCKDSADVDLRSDVYSFATILYEMLAGRTPHLAATGTEMLVMHLMATPPPLHELVADVPAHVEAAIVRGLARARDDRFENIPAFLEALQGSVASGTSVLSQPEPSKKLPTTKATPEVRVERFASLPAATTFSRATGEVVATDDEELLLASTRPRRRLPITIGCTAVAAIGALVLVQVLARPSHDSVPRATPVTAPERAIEPVRQEALLPTPPVALPARPDAGAIPSGFAGAAPVTKPEHEAAIPSPTPRRPRHEAKNTLAPKPPENTKPEQAASVPVLKKPAGVAGF
jgi:serine/threonine-protein kinase